MTVELKNAIITKVSFCTDRGLTLFVTLDYGGVHQSFGGFGLGGGDNWRKESNYAARFINRLLDVTAVDDLQKMIGKTVRVKCNQRRIMAIGHIVKDDWFNPEEELAK